MKSITVVNSDPFFNKDFLFQNSDKTNLLYPFYMLKKELLTKDIAIHTSDVLSKDDADFIIYNEIPKNKSALKEFSLDQRNIDKSYLMLLECAVIRPDNYDKYYHKFFNKVFTWDDDLIASDPNKYKKLNFTQSLKQHQFYNERNKFCVCIAGNKKMKHKNELYSKRIEVIKWFEKNNLDNFDLYGRGWGSIKFNSNTILKPLNKFFSFFENKNMYKSWKGSIENKHDLLTKYKFNFCIENATNYNGYITEKIFDSFRSGCIPIYMGPKNIDLYIPRDCYIPLDEFHDFKSCHDFIANMSNFEISNYQKRIKTFLNSEEALPFSYKTFIAKIEKELNLN